MECIPARLPSAAEHLALSFSPCGGSSIHIKAEVTHGAGECTNEALSVMMGGSGSCWCNLPWAVFQKMELWFVKRLLYLVEFGFDLILVYCHLNEIVSWSYYYYHPTIIIISPTTISGNLVNHFSEELPSDIFPSTLVCLTIDFGISKKHVVHCLCCVISFLHDEYIQWVRHFQDCVS